jgi:hypothetical protein
MKTEFETLKERYPESDAAFPSHLPKPNEKDLNEIITTHNCKLSPSFIAFQLVYCHITPIGDFAFNGFGWANKELDAYLNLEEVVKDFRELDFPNYLTPFKQDNGDFWCFDNRSDKAEYPVVIWDHNSGKIEQEPEYQWANFLDWLSKTLEE